MVTHTYYIYTLYIYIHTYHLGIFAEFVNFKILRGRWRQCGWRWRRRWSPPPCPPVRLSQVCGHHAACQHFWQVQTCTNCNIPSLSTESAGNSDTGKNPHTLHFPSFSTDSAPSFCQVNPPASRHAFIISLFKQYPSFLTDTKHVTTAFSILIRNLAGSNLHHLHFAIIIRIMGCNKQHKLLFSMIL